MVSRIVKLISNTVSNNSCLSCSKLLKVGALTAADLVAWMSTFPPVLHWKHHRCLF